MTRLLSRDRLLLGFKQAALPEWQSQIVETIISVNGEKRLGLMRWGFVSPTAKEPKLAPINAREGLVHLSDVPGRLPTPSLPRHGRRPLRVAKERRTQEDAVIQSTQVGTALRLRRDLVHQAWRKGTSPCHLRHRHLPSEQLMAKIHDRMPDSS